MHCVIGAKGLGRIAIGGLLLASTACQEANPDFDGPASSASSSGADGSSGTASTTSPMTTSGMEGTGSTSLPLDTSDTMPPGTSSSDTVEPTGTTAGSSSSGGEEPLYPPCMLDEDPVCPSPYEECYDFLEPDFTVCTLPCEQDDECPVPASGDAQAVCAGQNSDQCVLDCSGGATCPDGMECQEVGGGGMFERCVWPS